MPHDPKSPFSPAFAIETAIRSAQASAAQFSVHSARQLAGIEDVFRQAHEAQERERLAVERERAANERVRQAQLETAAAVKELAEASKRQARKQWIITLAAALFGAAVTVILGAALAAIAG